MPKDVVKVCPSTAKEFPQIIQAMQQIVDNTHPIRKTWQERVMGIYEVRRWAAIEFNTCRDFGCAQETDAVPVPLDNLVKVNKQAGKMFSYELRDIRWLIRLSRQGS